MPRIAARLERHNESVSQSSMSSRSNRGPGGIFGAFVAILGLIAVIGAMTWFLHRDNEDPARTVDYRPALVAARAQAPFPVLAPKPVPAGLRATSVMYDGLGAQKSWRLGFVTEDGEFIGLYEGNGPAEEFIDASTPATTPGPPATIGGEEWLTLRDDGRGETALVRTINRVTTVVTGTVDQPALVAFAAALH